MNTFYKNVTALIPASRFRSGEELSAFAFDGRGKYLANAAKKNQDPSLRRAKQIADALGVPLDRLLQEDMDAPEAQDQLMAVLQAVTASKTVDALGGLIEHVDLYHQVKPTDRSLKIYRVGKQSLSSRVLQRSAISNMRAALRSMSPELDTRLRTSYEAAAAGIPVLSVETLDEPVPVPPYHIKLKYVRLLMSVAGPNGEDLILTYCLPMHPA